MNRSRLLNPVGKLTFLCYKESAGFQLRQSLIQRVTGRTAAGLAGATLRLTARRLGCGRGVLQLRRLDDTTLDNGRRVTLGVLSSARL